MTLTNDISLTFNNYISSAFDKIHFLDTYFTFNNHISLTFIDNVFKTKFGLYFFLGSDAVLYSEQQFSPPHVKVNAQLGLSFQTEFTIIRKLEQKISKFFPLVEFI